MASHTTSANDSESAPPAQRLVIRVNLGPENPPPPPTPRRSSKAVVLLILASVAVLLGWIGVKMLRTEPAAVPAVTDVAPQRPVPSAVKPAVSATPPTAATEKTATKASETKPAEPEARTPSGGSLKEVIPNVPLSARNTIRGTIRVTIRAVVDQQGAVLAATTHEPGPSRYFERLALEAARKWTFPRSHSTQQRVMLVSFNFTRTGTSARATAAADSQPLQGAR